MQLKRVTSEHHGCHMGGNLRYWLLCLPFWVASCPVQAQQQTEAERIFDVCVSDTNPSQCLAREVRPVCPWPNPQNPDDYDLGCAGGIGEAISKLVIRCVGRTLHNQPPPDNEYWGISLGADFGNRVYAKLSGIYFGIDFVIKNERVPFSALVIHASSPGAGTFFLDGVAVGVMVAPRSEYSERPAIIQRLQSAKLLKLKVDGKGYHDLTADGYLEVPAAGLFEQYAALEHAFESCGYRISK